MKLIKNNEQVDRSEQAALWFGRMNDERVNDDTRREFLQWLDEHAENRNEYLAMVESWTGLDEMDASDQLKLHALAHHSSQASRSLFSGKWMSAIAATVILGMALLWQVVELPDSHYVTAIGETREVLLADGSTVLLNTQSELEWVGGETERRAILHQGEALFDVEPDPDKPFVVEAGSGIVRVLGTRFNVYRKPDSEVVVTVLEGEVAVADEAVELDEQLSPITWQHNLVANQEITYSDNGVKEQVAETDAEKKVSWREGVLLIDDQPLVDVVAEISRYSDRRIVILDTRLNQIRFGGAVSIADIRKALSVLEQVAPIQVSDSKDGYTISYKSNVQEND